jgi:phosphoglycerate dehydrogenase-like enzyme
MIKSDTASPRVLLITSTGFTPDRVDELRKKIPGADFVTAPDNLDAINDAVAGVNGLVGCPRWAFSADLLRRAGNGLGWVHVGGAGCEEFLIPEFVASDIILTNGRIIQGPEVADHAMALLLSVTRNLHLIIAGKTAQPMPRPLELRGKTMLVVGLGGIGMLVAERAAAFGMRVIGINPDYVPMLSMIERVLPPERMHEVLPEADVVAVVAPNTPATRGMFGHAEFAAMKPSAYFIAVSRGKLIDTNALTNAMNNSAITAAGLDVTDPEPLPDDHPLRHMDNVVITPHIAGLSEHNRQRSFDLIQDNLERFTNGLPLYNIVDKELGY